MSVVVGEEKPTKRGNPIIWINSGLLAVRATFSRKDDISGQEDEVAFEVAQLGKISDSIVKKIAMEHGYTADKPTNSGLDFKKRIQVGKDEATGGRRNKHIGGTSAEGKAREKS